MVLFDAFKKKVEEKSEEINPLYNALNHANLGVENMQVSDHNGVVTITGDTDHGNVLQKVNDFLNNQPGVQEVINRIEVKDVRHQGIKMFVVTKGSNLNVRAGEGTEYDILGKFPKGTEVNLVKRVSDTWFIVEGQGMDGQPLEGYCHTDYLVNS
jgi:carbamoylphosphate synthase small subunit